MTPPKKTAKKAPAPAPAEGKPLPELLLEETREHREQNEKEWGPLPELGIAERIKEARQRPENGLTIESLSRMCKLIDPAEQGISHQTLVKYEKGIVLPGSRELRILCDALAVSADWLLMGREKPGYITMDLALTNLGQMIQERIMQWNHGGQSDLIRSLQLEKAKEPKPRK